MQTLEWLTLSLVVATILVALATLRAVSVHATLLERHMRLMTFASYSGQYRDVLSSIPQLHDANIDVPRFLADTSHMARVQAYFDLCFEEHLLGESGLMGSNFERILVSGLQTALRRPILAQAWLQLRQSSDYSESFVAMVDRLSQDNRPR